jgi:hypothetical protein
MIFSTSGYAFAGGSVVDSELRLAASPTHAIKLTPNPSTANTNPV